jgi:ABC-type Fe3+ transport system permease subunit
MNRHAFFRGAILLALVAFITHLVARGFLVDAMHRKGERLEWVQKQHIAYTPDPQALRSSRSYNILTTVGVLITALSLVCMGTAMVRRENGWYLILILLLFFDVALPMLL